MNKRGSMQTTSTSNIDITGSERIFGKWVVWAGVLLLGFIMFGVAQMVSAKKEASADRVETTAVRLQGNINELVALTRASALGDEAALAKVNIARTAVQDDLSLLQRGGYLFSDDSTPLEGLVDISKVNLNAVQEALTSFDLSAQPILNATDGLRQSSKAERLLPIALSNISEGSLQMNKFSNLSSGTWGAALNPIRQDLTRSDLSSLPTVFAPGGNTKVARQWSDMVSSRADEAKRLNDLASKQPQFTTSERDLLSRWTQNVVSLATQLEILLKNMDARATAKASVASVQESSEALFNAASALNRSVHDNRVATEGWNVLKIVAIALILVSFIGLLHSVWQMVSLYNLLRGGNARGNQVVFASERLSRNLKKVITTGSFTTDITEPTDSPLFALSSMINQMLNSFSSTINLMTEQSSNMSLAVNTSETMFTSVLNGQYQQQEALNSIHVNTQSSADELKDLSNKWKLLFEQYTELQNEIARGSALVQENVWLMDSIRENTQSSSKRVKRLGETTQNIATEVEVVKNVSRMVKVLALNIALEAASLGANGRSFSALAQELERLAQNCDIAIKDIDAQIDTIQTDAKETVSSMETGTSEVVRSGKLSSSAVNSFKNIEKTIQPLKEQTEDVVGYIENMSTVLREEALHTSGVFQNMKQEMEKLDRVKTQYGVFRNAVNAMQKWLTTPLR